MPQFSTDIYNVSIQSFRLHTDLEGSSHGLGPMPNTKRCMPPLRLASWHQPAVAIPTARRLLPEGCIFHPQVHISSLLMLCSFTATEAWRTQAPLSAGDALGQPQGPLALNKGLSMEPVRHRHQINQRPLLRVWTSAASKRQGWGRGGESSEDPGSVCRSSTPKFEKVPILLRIPNRCPGLSGGEGKGFPLRHLLV